jgi:hypothetical protein
VPKLGETSWDAALARRLYDAGATYKAIGERVGAEPQLVSQFAARHWPERDKSMAYRPGRHKRELRRPRPLPPGHPTLPPLRSLLMD